MRNGQYTNNLFIIGISRLDRNEKLRLIAILQSKLGLESYVTMNGARLAIKDPQKVVDNITPFFHPSQLHRLVKISR